MALHLLADISAHGYGHLSQTAPVLNELKRRLPGLRLTVRCSVPREILAQRFDFPFDHVERALDFGMVMDSAVDVRVEDSARAYEEFHRDWAERVAREAEVIGKLGADLLLANIPYLSLAAAAQAQVPAAALCSLNWADIYTHYCRGLPGAGAIHRQMLEAYRNAQCFLRLTPGMSMADLPARRAIGPVARLGANRQAELRARLGLAADQRLALIALGGIPMGLPLDHWPRTLIRWIVPGEWNTRHPDAVAYESLGMPFTDVLASCDVLITKPGYGSFAEAACNGVRVLYLSRPDWPETLALLAWLQANAACLPIERDPLNRGEIAEALERLMALPVPAIPRPTGIFDAADYLEGVLTFPPA